MSDGTTALIPVQLQEILEVIRNIALIAVPFVLFWASGRVAKKRSTLEMVRSLESAPEIVDRLERLYQFRRYEQDKDSGAANPTPNPYADSYPDRFKFDCVIALNYVESACTEILEGHVIEDLLYKAVRNTIIGANDTLLRRYSEKVGFDQASNYPHLGKVARNWKTKATAYSEIGAIQIPPKT